jgi:hypothetical protein
MLVQNFDAFLLCGGLTSGIAASRVPQGVECPPFWPSNSIVQGQMALLVS